jgi:hypothetical protein
MGATNPFTYKCEEFTLRRFHDLYVRPGSRLYKWSYRPDEPGKPRTRRVLFPRKVLYELEIQAERSDLSMLLNVPLKLFAGIGEELDFVKVEEMDKRLGKEHESKVNEFLREKGEKYYDRLSGLIPYDFYKGYKYLMTLYDLAIGTLWKNIEGIPPGVKKEIKGARPGCAYYACPLDQYPFDKDSPSEIGVCSFNQGIASRLHSKDGTYRKMKALIEHRPEENRVKIVSINMFDISISKFEKLKGKLR